MLVLTKNPEKLKELEDLCFNENAYSFNMLETITDTHQCFLIHNESIEIIGYLILLLSGDEWELVKIGVLPQYRKQGFAKQAILQISKDSKRNIFLEVNVNNHETKKLYENCGFVQIGYRRNYYNDGSDAVIMKLSYLQ